MEVVLDGEEILEGTCISSVLSNIRFVLRSSNIQQAESFIVIIQFQIGRNVLC